MIRQDVLSAAAFFLAEVLLFWAYLGHGSSFHWFTHFYAGASAALLLMAGLGWFRRRPPRRPLLWILAAHLFASLPDLLFAAGIAHQRWMDIFLLHISSHFIPGRNWSLYLIFVASLGAYLLARARRFRTGNDEPPLA